MMAFICCSATSGFVLKVSMQTKNRAFSAAVLATAHDQRRPRRVLARDPTQRAPAVAILEAVRDVPHVRLEPRTTKQPRRAPPMKRLGHEPHTPLVAEQLRG